MDGSPLQPYVPLSGMHADHVDVCNENIDGNLPKNVNIASTSTKRRYTFINKIPKNTPQPASIVYVSREAVQRISCIDCCKRKCCQLIDCDVLMRMRQDFWGQSQKSRTNYVYDVLSTAWHHDSRSKIKYAFRLHGVIVCCRDWYEMHGIPKTSF